MRLDWPVDETRSVNTRGHISGASPPWCRERSGEFRWPWAPLEPNSAHSPRRRRGTARSSLRRSRCGRPPSSLADPDEPQRARSFPCCVVGEGERSLRVVGRCSSSGCEVTTGRLKETLDGCRVSRHLLKLLSGEQALDDFASFVPSRHLSEGIGPRGAARSELGG